MAVLATKSVPSCKLCKHPRRAEIDVLLEKRSDKVRDPGTKKLLFTGEIVKRLLAEQFDVENPTDENINVHWRKHCEKVSEEEAQEVASALDEHQEELLALVDGSDGTVDGDLRVLFKLGMARIRGRILRGEDGGVSVDHVLKASAELTKRQDNEVKRDVLTALAGGVGLALSQAMQPKQLSQPVEVIDAEPVEETA